VYFHFPGGKAQLAVEAAKTYAGEQAELIGRAAEGAHTPVDLVTAYVTRARENLVKSDFTEGCTIAPLVLEGARESEALANAGSAAFSLIIESLAFQFAFLGMNRADARELAEVAVSGVEGALVTARALRSPAPFDSMLAALVNHAARLTAAEPRSTPEPGSTSAPPQAHDQADSKETRA
jgi:TetR/AcrR family transcriptional repressor of lmrAB and yxaGH operons